MSVDQLTCMICLDVAEEAMESSCCHQLFCRSCTDPLRKCPNCRAKFTVQVAHFARRLIGQLEAVCSLGCGLTLSRSELRQHEQRCPRRAYTCPGPGCTFSGPRQQYIDHLVGPHADELIKHADRLFTHASPQTDSHVLARGESHLMRRKNARGADARLGSTGKFYCGARLGDPGCVCCNGHCGPTNGCNCSECMLLDVQERHLPKGWLVNNQGAPCRKNPESVGLFYCGRCVMRRDQFCDGYCGPTNGPNCQDCQKIARFAENRYERAYRQ